MQLCRYQGNDYCCSIILLDNGLIVGREVVLSEFSLLVKLFHWVTASHNDGMYQAIMTCLGRQCGQSNGK